MFIPTEVPMFIPIPGYPDYGFKLNTTRVIEDYVVEDGKFSSKLQKYFEVALLVNGEYYPLLTNVAEGSRAQSDLEYKLYKHQIAYSLGLAFPTVEPLEPLVNIKLIGIYAKTTLAEVI